MTVLEYVEDVRKRCAAELELTAKLCEMKAAQIRDAEIEGDWRERARFYKKLAEQLKW